MSDSVIYAAAAGAGTKFPLVDDKTGTISNLVGKFPVGTNIGGVDHFTAYFTELGELHRHYNNGLSITDCYTEIKSSDRLKTWFYSVLCAFLYGCKKDENGVYNSLHVCGVPTPKATFLKIWKRKFLDSAGANNSNDVNPALTNDLQMMSFAGIGMQDDYDEWLGCCSEDYLVIPMKELELAGRTHKAWKKKLLKLIREGDDALTNADKAILKVTADSIVVDAIGVPNYAPKIFGLIKKIIDQCIAPQIQLPDNPICNKTQYPINNTNPFFKLYTLLGAYADYLFEKKLAIGMTEEKGGEVVYCTYPFTKEACVMLEQGGLIVSDLSVDVKTHYNKADDTTHVDSASVNIMYTCQYVFDTPPGASNILVQSYPKETLNFDRSNIINIKNMSTFFMYPNFPLDLEHACNEFTYFSNNSSRIFESELLDAGMVIDFAGNDGKFVMYDTATGREQDMFTGGPSVNTQIRNRPIGIKHTMAGYCSHLIAVRGYDTNHNEVRCGYILNATVKNPSTGVVEEKPALIKLKSHVSIDLNKKQTALTGTFQACVDFGSSSSCVRYKIAGAAAALDFGLVKDRCTLRTLLVDYTAKLVDQDCHYKFLMNTPGEFTSDVFPSLAVDYNSGAPSLDYYPYKHFWMPLTKQQSDFDRVGVIVETSNKVDIPNNIANKNPHIIITNIVYMIVCNAIMHGCDNIWILPSLPSDNYLTQLQNIWQDAITNVLPKFGISISNVHTGLDLGVIGQHFLYESIAIAYRNIPVAKSMAISIDIGDSTTDMTALYRDAVGTVYVCGYSSMNYAGKQLIKQVVRDVADKTANRDVLELILAGLKGADHHGNPLFAHANSQNQRYADATLALCNSFYDGQGRKNKPLDYWENCIVEILGLENAGLESTTGAIDWKIASDLILRYLFMMPVFRKFIETAIKKAGAITGSPADLSGGTTINFYGGAGAGVQLIEAFDIVHVPNSIYDRLKKYFQALPNANVTNIFFISGKDSKHNLVDGLSMINYNGAAGPRGGMTYTLRPNLGAGVTINPVNWVRDIDPTAYGYLGQGVHQGTLPNKNYKFNVPNPPTLPLNVVYDNNKVKIQTPVAYFVGNDTQKTAFEEFKNYYDEELYSGIIDNTDGAADPIEVVTQSLLVNDGSVVKRNMFEDIRSQATAGDSFKDATDRSSLYPEMIKYAIFMFVGGRILSKYCGEIPKEILLDPVTAANYPFGV